MISSLNWGECMYAIVESNGKQYRVEEGIVVDMEKMEVVWEDN